MMVVHLDLVGVKRRVSKAHGEFRHKVPIPLVKAQRSSGVQFVRGGSWHSILIGVIRPPGAG
jgi:hypothetical protein